MAIRHLENINALSVKIFWACLDKVNDLSGKFQMDIGPLPKKTIEQLKAAGFKNFKEDAADSKTKGERGTYVTLKSATNEYIRLLDKDGNRLNLNEVSIGNGTSAHVAIHPYAYDAKGKNPAGVGLGIDTIKILNLVEVPKYDPFADEDGGSESSDSPAF